MTVSELIETLREFNQDSMVLFFGHDGTIQASNGEVLGTDFQPARTGMDSPPTILLDMRKH